MAIICRQKKLVVVAAGILCAAILLYLVSFLVVFDLGETAFSWDEDNYGNRQVAIGPRPRAFFDGPTHWGTAYDPSQWSFGVYRPLCEVWLRVKGLAPPAEWRD